MSSTTAADETIDPRELAEAEKYHSKENFIRLHKPQFQAMKLPASLMNVVYDKLLNEQFDALESFQVELVEDEGFRVVVSKEGGLKAGKDVWILDHLWTTTIPEGPKQLKEIDGLVDRLWTLADMDTKLGAEKALAAIDEPVKPVEATSSSTSTTAAPASAAAPIDIDEDTLSAIMSEASVSRERALEAYQTNHGDLIQSITWCGGETEREKATKAHMEQICEQQAQAQLQPAEEKPLTLEQKIPILWEGLFRYGLVGSYFTTLKNEVSGSSLKQEDVQTTLYVNDEIGSAVGQASDPSNANAEMQPLVVVTLGGVGFSLLWLTEDVPEGGEILIPQRPPIRLPGVPWPKK